MAKPVRKLIVEIVEATDLLPKDGHGASSPYVVTHYYGQRRRTRTVIRDLNPKWNEILEFTVGNRSPEIFGNMLELDVYHDKNFGPTQRNNFLGRIKLSSSQFVRKGEEALIYYPLEKKSFLSWIRGEIGLRIYYVDEVVPPPLPPPAPPAPEEAKTEAADQKEQPEEKENAPEATPDPAHDAQKQETPPPAVETSAPPPEPDQAKPTDRLADSAEKIEETPPAEGAKASSPPPEVKKPPEESQEVPPSPAPSFHSAQPEREEAPHWIPPSPSPEMMAATVSASIPQVKFDGVNTPPPIPRPAMTRTFTTDSLDSLVIERSSFDLVDKMHYVFVRTVKARRLPTNGSPVVRISVGSTHIRSQPARKSFHFFEWDQTFAFRRDTPESTPVLEVSVWAPHNASLVPTPSDVEDSIFFGGICFDAMEIPLRDPPDSPLAPQWYRLEGGGAHDGDLMLATWIGTQADESFADAWKTDTAGNNVIGRAKIYQSPKLWYLRATIVEAQDVAHTNLTPLKEASFQVKAQLGFQLQKTKILATRDGTLSWNEDLLFVAAEPFSDQLALSVEKRLPKGPVVVGIASVPLTTIERRVDDRKVASRWFTLFQDDSNSEKAVYKGRLHLRLCFDGGYHVMDEAAHVCSDYRPTARQLWKPPIGTVELGIIGCKNLLPMKSLNGKGSTDAYCVAKYGPKWVRTRTLSDTLEPRWNEQYSWRVYDPCTVLTIGVFDSWEVVSFESHGSKDTMRPDFRIGKLVIRISTLQTNKVYRNTYPLLVLSNSGMKKMGEIEVALRFIRSAPTLDLLHVYCQPLLPIMHHIKPLGVAQQETLRSMAVKIVAAHLSRAEPPLGREIVSYMLNADSFAFSIRKVKANWFRIINVIAGLLDIAKWVEDTREWRNTTATLLVHALFVMLVWFPDLIVPTLAFYVFVMGSWNYRLRSRDPQPHCCPKMSLADCTDRDELDEEFDTIPSSRPSELVRMRYDKLRMIGVRVQSVLGDFATQGERVQALVTWRDPRATGIFIGLCFVVAMILYLVPTKMVAMASGFYYFRHPIFRDQMPSPVLNFFRRLPSLADRMM